MTATRGTTDGGIYIVSGKAVGEVLAWFCDNCQSELSTVEQAWELGGWTHCPFCGTALNWEQARA
jgi:hypothetical protein